MDQTTTETTKELPQTPEVGLYPGVPEKTYRAWDALGSTDLWTLAHACPAAFKWRREHPEPQTEAMAFGSLVHTYVLEPHLFHRRYMIIPPEVRLNQDGTIHRGTKEGKELAAKLAEEAGDRILVSQQQTYHASQMSCAIRAFAPAAELLDQIEQVELSGVFSPLPEVRAKLRVDALASHDIIDLKTSANAAPWAFTASAARYGYHVQAAWYTTGLHALTNVSRNYRMIVVESEPPHAVGLYSFDRDTLLVGMRIAIRAAGLYQQCRETGNWGSYGEAVLRMPKWALNGSAEEGDDND